MEKHGKIFKYSFEVMWGNFEMQAMYSKSIAICIGIAVFLVILIVAVIRFYLKGKKNLKAEEVAMKEQMKQDEKRLQEKIRAMEEEIEKRKEELDERIQKFNREQALREDIAGKSDRDVLVELYVKIMRIFATLESMDDNIARIDQYSEKIDKMDRNINNRIFKLNRSIEEIAASMDDDDSRPAIETVDDRIIEKLCQIREDISDLSGTIENVEYQINNIEYIIDDYCDE